MNRSWPLALVVVCGFAMNAVRADDDAPRLVWQPVIEGKLATVSVAKALYEQKDGKYFLAGVRVTNKTDREIGVDLRYRQYSVRINQWGASDALDLEGTERRVVRTPFTEADQASLVSAFRDGKLVRIPAGKSVEYYCPFTSEEKASTRAAVDKLRTKYVILKMDGELRVTNGEQSESLRRGDRDNGVVSIVRPVPWHTVPKDGRIASDDRTADADAISPVDEIWLHPPNPTGWIIRFRLDGSAVGQFGSDRGDRAELPKGSVHFGALVKAVYHLKSDKRVERQSTISVPITDEAKQDFALLDDTLFRYLIDSFENKWQAAKGREHFETLRREHPIYQDVMPAAAWRPLIDGKLATVSVAKALFEQKDCKSFLAGIRVTNKTDREIAVDLRRRRYSVGIRQFSAIDCPERGLISEQRQIPPEFTAKDQASLVTAFRDSKLVRIPAGKSVEYFSPFDGGNDAPTRAVLERLPTKYFILSMSGELRVTNGEESEELRCGEPGKADVPIARPAPWHRVPSGERIISDESVAGADKTAFDAVKPVIEGKMATVSVAKALFEQKDGKYFLAGVRVTNKTDGAIGVDLRSRQFCVRINHWTASDTAERTTIDEQREIRPAFTREDQTALVTAFRNGDMVRIPAGKSVDYYCPFIGEAKDSNRASIEKLPTKFVILSMDGELRVTNGEQSESLRCGEPGEADVSIPRPVSWHQVPSGARIVSDDGAENAILSWLNAAEVESLMLAPRKPSSGWMISFYPNGRVNAQFGSAEGQAVHLPKGSVDFKSLLKAACRLKSDQQLDLEQASSIAVSFKNEPNLAFSLSDDTLFRYLIDSFHDKWQPDLAVIGRVDKFLREHPIFVDEKPATQP